MLKSFICFYNYEKPVNFLNLLLIISSILLCFNLSGTVTFTQSTSDDFYSGYQDNVLVASGDISLPSKADGVNQWNTTTDLPQNLSGHRIVNWKSHTVYLVGGDNGTGYSSSVYRNAMQTGGIGDWIFMNSLPAAVRDHAVVIAVRHIYVFGGLINGNPSDSIFVADINLDGSLGNWQLSSVSLPQPMWGHTAKFINGFIYLVGGSDQSGGDSATDAVYSATVNPYGDLSEFTATTSLPEPRNGHTMVTYDDMIYILGGYDNSGIKHNTVFYTEANLDGTCSSWLTSATTLPDSISNHSSTCYNGIVTVIGGDPGELYSNLVHYADIDGAPDLVWNTSPNYLFDRCKDAQAFAGNGKIIYAGGEYLSGDPVDNTRYSVLDMTSEKVQKSAFVSYPFYQLGEERELESLNYSISYNSANDNYELFYRVAGNDEVWSNWYSEAQNNPAAIGLIDRYVQYMFKFTATSTDNIALHDVTLNISGYTELGGNLNSIDTLTVTNSPYWVTSDISFTSGTHYVEPGVEIVFSPGTGLEIGQASFYCNGTAADSIKFTSYNDVAGDWKGIYFNDLSDSGVTSELTYTIIEKAGYGSWNANLYCYNTNKPYISNSDFRYSVGNGIRLSNSDLSIENSVIRTNTENGLHLSTSESSLMNVDILSNDNAGIHYSSLNSNLTVFSCNVSDNHYGIYYPSPNSLFPLNSSIVFNNNEIGHAVAGGTITAFRTWAYIDGGYTVLGDITVALENSHSRLTIAPGNTIRCAKGVQIQMGYWQNYHNPFGGDLYAVGTVDSIITFTALNDSVGGWDGLHFHDYSDIYGATSLLEHCKIEKSNNNNIYSVNTNQPTLENCIITESGSKGLKLVSAPISINNTTIETNPTGVYSDNSQVNITNSIIQNNSNYEIYTVNPTGYPNFTNTSIISSGSAIRIGGGIQASNKTWIYFNGDYQVMGDVTIGLENSHSRLSVAKGNTIKFAENVQLQMGYWQNYHNPFGGDLYAVGTVDSIITFTALSDSIGGWDGLHFHDYSDSYGATSFLEHCKIEKSNSNNIYSVNTNQPTLQNCLITDSSSNGIKLVSAPISINNTTIETNPTGVYSDNSQVNITNSFIQNNFNYEVYAVNPNGYPNFTNTSIISSGSAIRIGGGTQSFNKTWIYFNGEYHILGDVTVAKESSKCRLTIDKDNTLRFAEGVQLQIGYSQNYHNPFSGELRAIGNADSLITFTSMSDSTSWDGIYFHDYNDHYSATSSLNYCVIENGNSYDLYCHNSGQPTINNSEILNSSSNGVKLVNSPISISNSNIEGHVTGIYFDVSSASLDNVNIHNNSSIGIWSSSTPPTINNSQISNNNLHEIYCTHPNGYPNLTNSPITANGSNITITGAGHISSNRVWRWIDGEYHILGDVTVAKEGTKCRLTIEAGNILKFAAGVNIQVGYYQSYHNPFGGELRAIGTSDNVIIFTSLNAVSGGWDGIYFHDYNDYYGAYSVFNHCVIEKGNAYNVYCYNSNEPDINHSILRNSAGYGLSLNNSSLQILISQFVTNNSYGIYLSGNSNPTIGNVLDQVCDLWGNNSYDIYNDTGNNINARHNFWNSIDSTFIDTRIYDNNDNAAKGYVYYAPIADSSLFDNMAPANFSLISMADNEATPNQSPTFTWQQATDPNGEPVSYYFYYTEDSTWVNYITSEELSDTTYTIPSLLDSGKWYWWKVLAIDSYLETYSNETWKFGISQPPTIPMPILPENGDIIDSDDYLVWLQSTDPDDGDYINYYHLQIDNNSDFSSPVIDMTEIWTDPELDIYSIFSKLGNDSEKNNSEKSRVMPASEFDLSHGNERSGKTSKLMPDDEMLLSEKDQIHAFSRSEKTKIPTYLTDDAYPILINQLTNYTSLVNTMYYWRVSAVDAFGIEGNFSDGNNTFIYGGGIVLSPPYNLATVLNEESGEVFLSWEYYTPVDDPVFQYFKLYRDEVEIGITSDSTYTDILPDFGSYAFIITAVYDDGESEPTSPAVVEWLVPWSHFDPVYSGTGYNNMILTINSAEINYLDMVAGDEIGVFDGDICVGAARLSETIGLDRDVLQMVAAADDPETAEIDGFTDGNTIIYKLWDAADEIEITYVIPNYTTGNGLFLQSGSAELGLEGFGTTQQTMDLLQGWNMISFFNEPANMDIEAIMQVLIDAGELEKVQDETGSALVFLPGTGWINSIGNMATTEGYYVNVNIDTQLLSLGAVVALPKEVPLLTGWNMMGYPVTSAQDALSVVQPLIDNELLVKVQDEAGLVIVNLPGIGWFNSIGDFLPGEGYYINVNAEITLTINEPVDLTLRSDAAVSRKQKLPDKIRETTHFIPAWSGNPYLAMNVFVTALQIEDLTINDGDEIGLFDGNVCVGSAVVSGDLISIIATTDDLLTEEVDGFTAGNEMYCKYWNSVVEEEMELTISELAGDETFTSLGTTVVELQLASTSNDDELIPTKTELDQNYPNPFNPSTTICFSLSKTDQVKIEIFNIKGQKIRVLVDDFKEAGYYKSVWNGLDENLKPVSSGIYFYKMRAGQQSMLKKMLLVK